jgi:glycosyltransferase involved in cell wall biosynthesis
VLDAVGALFPGAPLHTLVHARGSVQGAIEQRPIHRSFVQRLPRAARWYRQYLPAFPIAVECFDLDDFDLVISTSSCAAKSVVVPGRARHLCYCHSPMRYGWDQFDAYFGTARLGRAASALARHVMAPMARWDRDTAGRVDRFLANSHHVAGRIARYYNRDATVLYPPVDTGFFTPDGTATERYFLVVSALVPYKRLEIAIDAAARLGARLKVVGTGPDEARLRALGGDQVEWLGAVERGRLRDLYRRALALLLPGEEDFGIAPVEAMACGRPVVALARGGATETVEHGRSGFLVPDADASAFAEAMAAVPAQGFRTDAVRARAEQFSAARFRAGLAAAVADMLEAPPAC